MTLQNTQKFAKHLFRLLKVNEVIFPVGRTSRGNFGVRFTPNNDDYEMYLDAVPLSTKDSLADENNIELKKLIEKYMFEQTVLISKHEQPIVINAVSHVLTSRPRGRPKGSKNANTKAKKSS